MGPFGALNVVNTSRVFDDSSKTLQENKISDLQKRGLAQARDLVQSTKSAILQSDYTTLQGLMPEIAKEDPEIAYVYVADKEGTVLVNGEPKGRRMGTIRLKRGHQALLPKGSAYRYVANKASAMIQQTIAGELTRERWGEICYQ